MRHGRLIETKLREMTNSKTKMTRSARVWKATLIDPKSNVDRSDSTRWAQPLATQGFSFLHRKAFLCLDRLTELPGAHPEPLHSPGALHGYLGYKKPSARGSVGRRFLILRKPRAKPAGLRFSKIRKRTKAVGPRFLKNKKTHESGWSPFS